MAKNRRTPRPFKYRGRWRAQVTLSNGTRPHADFDTMDEAKKRIAEMLAEDKSYDKGKLRAMFSPEAERDWKLSWFAFSRMVAQAAGTDFARTQGWRRDEELSKLAEAHGYKSTGAAP